MSDPFEQDAVVHGAEATPDPSAGHAPDPFEQAMAAYDEAVPPKAEAPDLVEPQQQFDADDILSRLPAAIRTELEDRYHLGLHHLQQVAGQISQERERMDFSRLVETLRRDFPEMSRPHLETLLVGLHATNQRMAEAWSGRYNSARAWANMVERVKHALHTETACPVDRDMSDTVAAVNASVTRHGGNAPRGDAPVDWARMTDRELNQATRKSFGFDAVKP